MSIDWSHLPKEVLDKICLCSSGKQSKGYSEDIETGFWVHRVHEKNKPPCDKPSPLAAVLECDECEKPFVPAKQKTVKLSFLGAMCPRCEDEF